MPSAAESSLRDVPLLPCVAALLAVLAWLLPNHYLPWTTFHTDLGMAVAFLVGGGWAAWSLRGRTTRVSLLALLALGTAAIPAVQWLAGQLLFVGDFWVALLYLLGLSLSIAFGSQVARIHGAGAVVDLLAWAFLIAAVLCVGIQLYQWQRLDRLGSLIADLPFSGRPFANLGQPNLLALLLLLGLGGVAWLHHAGRFAGPVASLLVLFLGFGLAMSQSRAGLLAAVVAMAWLVVQRRHLGERLQPHRLTLAAGFIAACVLLWPTLSAGGPAPVGRAIGQDLQGGNRLGVWIAMLDAIGRHPWAGYGWLQVGRAHALVVADHPPMAAPELFEQAHNLPLELVVWSGLPLGLLLTVALVAWSWRVMQGAREPAAVLGVAMLSVVAVHSMLEFPYQHAYLLLPTGLLMGAVEASAAPTLCCRAPRWLLPALTLAAAVLTLLVVRDYLPLEEELRVIRFEERRIGVDQPRPPPPDTLLLTQLQTRLAMSRYTPRRDMPPADLDRLNRAAERYPYAFLLLRQAEALALSGQPDAAGAALRSICRTHTKDVCEGSRLYWKARAEKEAELAAVTGP